MRLEQIGKELSLDNAEQHQQPPIPNTIAASTSETTTTTTNTTSSSSSFTNRIANLTLSGVTRAGAGYDGSRVESGDDLFNRHHSSSGRHSSSSSADRSRTSISTPRTLGSTQRISPISPGNMSTRINSEFKKNMFYVNPDQQPITTTQSPEEVFDDLGVLGTGSGGNVLKMRHKSTGKICAVKQMRRTFNDEENKRIYMDLQVVLQCECDNIVRCCGYFIKESEVWICMELMETCFDKLLRERNLSGKKPLPEKFLGAIAASAVRALYYLKEKHNIIHRDVKPSNILINDKGQIKLCDFGISGRLIDSLAKTRAAGCIPYMAPERLDMGHHYDIRADVWSLGITLYELATGRSPYAECRTEFDILCNVVHGRPPALPDTMDFSVEFRNFISACLTKDFKQRPKYRQLIDHDFIVKHKNTVVSLSELD